MNNKGLTASTIKLIAAITMLMDHIAAVFISPDNMYWGYVVLRLIIGRISLPLFLYMLVEGFIHTKNVKKHALLLLIFAFISEIPHDYSIGNESLEFERQNVLFTLFAAFIALILVKKIMSISMNIYLKYSLILAATGVIALICTALKFEYSYGAVLAAVFMYLFHDDLTTCVISGCICLGFIDVSEIIGVLSLIILKLYNGQRGKNMKYFFYIFYPAHLLIIALISVNANAALGDLGTPRSSYELGSANRLEGESIIVSVFVDTPSYKWSEKEKISTLENLNTATVYITNKGTEYNVDNKFIYDWTKNTNLKYDVKMIMDPDDTKRYEAILDKRIAGWVEGMIKDSYSKVQNNEKQNGYQKLLKAYNADNIFMIVYFKAPGRSYAITYDGIDSYNESLIYFYEDGDDPAVLAHEILHLYGAHDYYEDAEYTKDAVKYIEGKYPNDIMLTTSLGKEISNELGELTAYHLGWKGSCDDTKKYPQLIR